MAENTEIQWPDHTFNPWLGCTKIGPGCRFCYAEAQMDNWLGRVQWGPAGTRMRTSEAYWRAPIRWQKNLARGWVWRCENCNERIVARGPREVLGDCRNCGLSVWRNIQREKVFCASLADIFEDNPQLVRWRNELFLDLIDETPYLDWLLLTKRPENIKGRMLPPHWRFQGMPDNVWLGTSVENQAAADERIPQLAAVPARVRFLSVEPLLGPINLEAFFYESVDERHEWFRLRANRPDWVIIGGESGPKARPMELAWVRDIIKQCRPAGVPVFVKQLGSGWAKENGAQHRKGGDMAEWPEDLRVREQVDAGGLRIGL